jgi:hypothetical protein
VTRLLPPDIDLHLHALCFSRDLLFLDLTGIELSSLSFLRRLDRLEVLILDSCANLGDCDLPGVKYCIRLNHFYIGFTKFSPNAISQNLPSSVHTLECSGVQFTLHQSRSLLGCHPHLLQVTISGLDPIEYHHLCIEFPRASISRV